MDTLSQLTEINLDDLVSSFGWENFPRLASLLRGGFRAPSEKFARQMLDFDQNVGRNGLPAASRAALARYASQLRAYGLENLPASGPALFLANHPGMTDTLSLFAAINRADLRIIALDRPFLQALPNTTRHLFFIDDTPAGRMRAVKQTASHLKNGGAVLTFPAGKIEPDADVYPGARESLLDWTDSAGVFLRFAPETQVIPTLARGVLWEKAVKHPLTRLKKTQFEREKLGAALQLLAHIVFDQKPLKTSIQFGPPICAATLGTTDSAAIHAALLEAMRALLQTPPNGAGTPIPLA